MNQLIKSKGINFGLVYGLALILPILYAYTIDLNYFVSFWALGILILTFFIHGFWVIGSLKKAQNGFFNFRSNHSSNIYCNRPRITNCGKRVNCSKNNNFHARHGG